MSLTGCAGSSHKDAQWCDFYQGLGANYTNSQGYVPSSVKDNIAEYC